MKKILGIGIMAIMLASCSHHTYVVKSDNLNTGSGYYPSAGKIEGNQLSPVKVPATGGEIKAVNFLPNATAFRMSGDYSNNVAVTLGPDGELIYFPAPTDITADSEPVELCDGWWLNNQGLGPNSVFTKYTFAEYASLPEVPSVEQIKLSIIPGAKVTQFMELPMKIGEANQNLEKARACVKK